MKYYKHFCVTEELAIAIDELEKREDLKHTQVVERAVQLFVRNGEIVPKNIKIRKRSHPDYIKRSVPFQVWIKEDTFAYLLEVAERENCTYSAILYHAVNEYLKTVNLIRSWDYE